MQNVLSIRNLPLGLAALLLVAASLSASAVFAADDPGSNLRPIGNADELVEILQDNGTILWNSLSGAVSSHTVQGWPSTDGESELGGALMIEKPDNAQAGVINFAEKPMTLSFEIGG